MRRTRRDFLKSEQTQEAASPQLRALAQQYLMARRQNTWDTIGRVAQGAVMGAAGMTPPEREVVDEDLLRASILQQLSEKTQSRARTEAERMAALGKIASSREEQDSALLDALQKVMSSAAGPAGTVAAGRIAALQQRASDVHDAVQATRLTRGERARILRATEGLDPTNDPVGVGMALSRVASGMPDKADQVVSTFFSSSGIGRYLGERDPQEYAIEVEATGLPEVQDLFQQATNINSGGAYAGALREASAIAEEAQRVGVPGMRQAADQLLAVARGAGAIPDAGGRRAEDRITEAILDPEALPPDEVEQMLMEQLRDLGQAPENLPEFRTKLMATPAFNEFVQQAGYEDSPFGRKQAFKDILTMQKMQGQESRRQQYQGYDREADEAKMLGTARSAPRGVGDDLSDAGTTAPPGSESWTGAQWAEYFRSRRPASSTPAPQSAAASVVGGAATTGSAAPRSEPEEEMERPVARPAIVPAGELLAAQEQSLAPIRASQAQKNAPPKAPERAGLDAAIDAYQTDRFGRPVGRADLAAADPISPLDAAIDAHQDTRFGRLVGEDELRTMRAEPSSVQGRVDRVIKGAGTKPVGESEQEPYDEYGESQASTSKQRRQRDLVAALLKRRVA